MKTHIVSTCILFIFSFSCLKAQDTLWVEVTDSSNLNMTPSEYNDSVFGGIDATQLSTGYLIESSGVPIEMDGWNGNDIDGYDTLKQRGLWFYHLAAIRGSHKDGPQYFPDADSVWHIADSITWNDTVAIMALFAQYNSLKPAVLDSATFYDYFYLNEDSIELQDQPERTESPYEEKLLFCMSPFFADTIRYYDSISFVLPAELLISNISGTINSIEIDFGDGAGYQDVQAGQVKKIAYNTDGKQMMKMVFKTTNGDFIARAEFYTWVDLDRPDTYNRPISTSLAQGNYSIYLGCDGVLNKPIIIVEGFDPKHGNTNRDTYDQFNTPMDAPFNETFIQSLQNEGYDFIFLDFTDKTNKGFIQYQATLVEELIDIINLELAANESDEEIIIMGHSMGGVAIRYALRGMEMRTPPKDHNVRMFIAHDSPMQGAYLPMGLQYLFKFIQYQLPEFEWLNEEWRELIKTSESPAATSLILFYPWNWIVNAIDYYAPHPNHVNLYTELQSRGYPTLTDNYSLINGATDNTHYGYNARDKILRWDMITGLVNYTADAWALPAAGSDGKIAQGILVRLGIPFIKRFVSIREALVPGLLPFDILPGSSEPTQHAFVEGVKSISVGASDNGNHTHAFIHSVSGLDLNNQSFGQNNQWYPHDPEFNIEAADVVANGLTPFDDYCCDNSFNDPHGTDDPARRSFPEAQAIWLRDKILNIPLMPAALPDINLGAEYNYGVGTSNQIYSPTRNINNGGSLLVNANQATGFGTGPVPTVGSSFTVYAAGCDPTTIIINDGGFMGIGDNSVSPPNEGILLLNELSTIHLNDGGVLEIDENSTLIVEDGAFFNMNDGSTLRINDNGRLIIDPGAAFTFNGGSIILDGNDAVIEIKGNIAVNSNFTFTGSGYLYFNQPGYAPPGVTFGTNGSMTLSGSGKTDEVMRVSQYYLEFPSTANSYVTINDGKVVLNQGSGLYFYCETSIDNSFFTALNTSSWEYRYQGVFIIDRPSTIITNSDFKHGNNGLVCDFNDPTYYVSLVNCNFDNNFTGFSCIGGYFSMDQCTSQVNDSYNIDAIAMQGTSSISLSSFYGSGIGISFDGNGPATLQMDCSDITYAQQAGIHGVDADIRLSQNNIQWCNTTCIEAAWGSILNISDLYSQGSNSIIGPTPIFLNLADDIEMGNATYTYDPNTGEYSFPNYNYIERTSSYHIDGYLSPSASVTCTGTSIVPAEGNYWVPSSVYTNVTVSCPSSSPPVTFSILPISYNLPCVGTGKCSCMMTPDGKLNVLEDNNRTITRTIDTMRIGTLAQWVMNHAEKDGTGNHPEIWSHAIRKFLQQVEDSNSRIDSASRFAFIQSSVLPILDSLSSRIKRHDASSLNWYKYQIAKGSMLRALGNLQGAAAVFDSLRQEAPDPVSDHINNWYCVTNAQWQVDQNIILPHQVDSVIRACRGINTVIDTSKIQSPYIISGMETTEKKEITHLHIFPNPATDELTLLYSGLNQSALITITDGLGRISTHKSLLFSNGRADLDLRTLPAGIYLLNFSATNTNVESRKFVITR